MAPTEKKSTSGNIFTILLLALIIVVSVTIIWRKQDVIDWWRLRGYTPSPTVQSLASDTKMSSYGRRLFYVNRPEILSGSSFSKQCDFGHEKTIVLGCYVGGDNGIYLYQVTEYRLDGVIQATAAHEMLHSAYNRLPTKQRSIIDSEIFAYYKTIQDKRILETVDAYRQSEPKELANEMHSIFGTEIMNLPPNLENYYRQYFTDRKVVVRLAEKYQHEFTTRRNQALAYDAELESRKNQIEANEEVLQSKERILEQQYAALKNLRQTNDPSLYNQKVDEYNVEVQNYNDLIVEVKNQIAVYNGIVEKRNALALEERELTQALTSKSL